MASGLMVIGVGEGTKLLANYVKLDKEYIAEIRLGERTTTGEYRLNGVEFILPYKHWPRDSSAPQIMGQTLNREDNLQFWYLHVWAWKPNPDGLFANFHPGVHCSEESRKVFRPSSG